MRMGGQPSVRWAEDGESLFHNGERIMVQDFTRALREQVVEAQKLLVPLLGGPWEKMRSRIKLGRIIDSMVRLGAGQSFATNPKNKWLEPGPSTVMRQLGTSIWNPRRQVFKREATKRWLRRLRVFREVLMVLVHAWGGLPGRGPEVATLRHCDSWQLIRNLFVVDGQVMIVTDRDKMKAIRDNSRKVARFVPEEIGQMMVAYIAWLIPAERALRRRCKLAEPRGEQLEFMWRDGSSPVWDTDRLSRKLARVLQAPTGVRLGVGRYRVVAIEMGRRIRGLVLKQIESQMDDDGGDDDDVEVDPVTGEPVHCGGSWNIVWDLASTHGSRVARQHYAVHIGFPGKLQPEMIATFKEISRLWHQFLEGDGIGDGKRRRAGEVAESGTRHRTDESSPKRIRSEATVEVNVEEQITTGLCKLLGPGATWRSEEQAESMRAIMALKDDQSLISVLPTGAGKSILFMLPAIMQNTGTSIVVVPFVALMEDLVTRAVAMGVDCIRFRSSLHAGREGLPRAARLVVVSADIVSAEEFSGYADGLLCTGLLQRIFIDECHTVITDVGYRVRLGELRGLHRYRCPLVLLTATLPDVLEDWFREQMLVEAAVTVRARTTKVNCRYRVEQVKPGNGAVERQVMETVRRLEAPMSGRQKGVIYCRSKRQCVAVAAEVGCGFHHGDMGEKEREEARTAWAEGRGHRWIAATTGLGTGIDIEGIVAVVHAEQPYGLVDFVQQTGRGGRRAGEVVESIIVHDGRTSRQDPHGSFVEERNRAEMEAFVSTPGCRRTIVSAFMDGVAGESCKDIADAEPCDRCEAQARLTAVGGRSKGASEMTVRRGGRWTEFGREEGQRVQMLFRWLDEVADECPVCHVRRHYRRSETGEIPDQPRHNGEGEWCKKVAGTGYDVVRKKIRFGPLSCCFTCKLPLDWCEETREGGSCAHVDKVLPVVLMGLKSWRVRELAKREFGVNTTEEEGFFRWLGARRRFHGLAGTNMHALWEAIIWEAYKVGRAESV